MTKSIVVGPQNWPQRVQTDDIDLRVPIKHVAMSSGEPQNETASSNVCVKIGRFWAHAPLLPQHESRMRQIAPSFTDDIIETVLAPFITQKHPVSLRALDWLVVNYSKKFDVSYVHTVDGQPTLIKLHDKYKDDLKHWRRKTFDAFRREPKNPWNKTTTRIHFACSKEIDAPQSEERVKRRGRRRKDDVPPQPVEKVKIRVTETTTIPQLNFMHWAIRYGVIAYAEKYLADIERDMHAGLEESNAAKKRAKALGLPCKRKELSQAPPARCSIVRLDLSVPLENSTT